MKDWFDIPKILVVGGLLLCLTGDSNSGMLIIQLGVIGAILKCIAREGF